MIGILYSLVIHMCFKDKPNRMNSQYVGQEVVNHCELIMPMQNTGRRCDSNVKQHPQETCTCTHTCTHIHKEYIAMVTSEVQTMFLSDSGVHCESPCGNAELSSEVLSGFPPPSP